MSVAAASGGCQGGTEKERKEGDLVKGPLWLIASAEPQNIPSWRIFVGNLLSGATAGCAVEAALYPIDTIKTRLQAMRSGGGIRALLKGPGSGKLYSGLWGNLAGVAPASALFFSVYQPCKHAISERLPEQQQFTGPLMAGALAGLAASLVRVPTEVVKQRMQTREFQGLFQAVSGIVGREGMKGLYAGYSAFLLRDLPFDAIEFFAYEALKSTYKSRVNREISAEEAAVTGAIAGGITGFVTTPFDVMKTRLMTQGISGTYNSVWDCTTKIISEEGVAALWKGWQPRLLWISIGGCIFFTALEEAQKIFVPKQPSMVIEKDKY